MADALSLSAQPCADVLKVLCRASSPIATSKRNMSLVGLRLCSARRPQHKKCKADMHQHVHAKEAFFTGLSLIAFCRSFLGRSIHRQWSCGLSVYLQSVPSYSPPPCQFFVQSAALWATERCTVQPGRSRSHQASHSLFGKSGCCYGGQLCLAPVSPLPAHQDSCWHHNLAWQNHMILLHPCRPSGPQLDLCHCPPPPPPPQRASAVLQCTQSYLVGRHTAGHKAFQESQQVVMDCPLTHDTMMCCPGDHLCISAQ